jgi:Flp pilus assembly protein TadG
MVEAAIIFPVLLYMVFGCVDFGQFLYIKHTMQGAAREGARAGSTPNTTNADVTTAVGNSMRAAGYLPAKYTVKIRNAADTADISVAQSAGTPILVRVESTWSTVGVGTCRVLGLPLISPTKVVFGATTMRKEG